MRLTTDDLVVGHRRVPVLRAGALAFSPGTITAILGPNGVGKSTLLRTLAGLMPPILGRVELNGRDLEAISRDERALELAFLAQEETAVFPLTVRQAVAIGRLPHSPGLRETPSDLAAIDAAIARVDLKDEADTLLDRLSGGQRRRATIARALAQEAPVILLDEPLVHLDPAHANEVLRTLAELKALGRTVLATFHEVDAALAIADRVVVLAERGIAFAGSPETLEDEVLTRTYGLPFARYATGERILRRPVWNLGEI